MSTTDDSWQSISLHTYRRDFCIGTVPFIFENSDDDMTMTLVRNGIDTFVEMPNAWPCVVVFKKRLSWRMWCRHWDSIITKKKKICEKVEESAGHRNLFSTAMGAIRCTFSHHSSDLSMVIWMRTMTFKPHKLP